MSLNRFILNTAVQDYINQNLTKNHAELALKGSPFSQVPVIELLEQLVSKSKAQHKLPTWFSSENIYYPNKINIEQTSSEATASYKSGIISGNSIIDLTGGFGVDCYYFAKKFKSVTHCEINKELHEIASHNFEMLDINNIKTIHGDGLIYLKTQNAKFDCIYVDPSRRHDVKGKVFMLKDCMPNIPENLDALLDYASTILVKTSPLLDIHLALSELKHVTEIHVVAVENEVKELLWVINKVHTKNIKVVTLNIKSGKQEHFEFNLADESQSDASLSAPLAYLFEPNAAILKSGAFKTTATKLGVKKLHQHTHLYTSDEMVEFPGRIFRVKKVVPFSKKALTALNITKANITTRNFPLDVNSIRKKFKIADGGDVFLFFTTIKINEKVILVCDKIS